MIELDDVLRVATAEQQADFSQHCVILVAMLINHCENDARF